MKRLSLGVVLVAAIALSIPASASAAEYDTFVGCDDSAANPVPANVCEFDDFPAAYFESDEDTEYLPCLEFPNADFICLNEERQAEAGVLDAVSLPTEEPGTYFAVWFVGEEVVGEWEFHINQRPPPPPTPAPLPAPAPVVVVPPFVVGPSKGCLTAKKKVTQLKSQLENANGRKQKTRLRGKLKGAKAAVKRAC
jgi:hypothetical protein